jgi:hypothetical protein
MYKTNHEEMECDHAVICREGGIQTDFGGDIYTLESLAEEGSPLSILGFSVRSGESPAKEQAPETGGRETGSDLDEFVFDPEEIITWNETMVGEPETPGPDIPLSIPVWEEEPHKKCRPSLKKRLARKGRERADMEKTRRRVSDSNKPRLPPHVAGRGSKGQEVSPYEVVASPGIGRRRVTDSNKPRLLPHVAGGGSKGLEVSPYEVVASCGIGRGIRRGWGQRGPQSQTLIWYGTAIGIMIGPVKGLGECQFNRLFISQ